MDIRRFGRMQPFRLAPLTDTLFELADDPLDVVRLEFVNEPNGITKQLVSHYRNGQSMVSLAVSQSSQQQLE